VPPPSHPSHQRSSRRDPWRPPSDWPPTAALSSRATAHATPSKGGLRFKKSLRFRSHSNALRKSHFGSEVTPTHSEKVTSVPKSLQRAPKKSLRFRSHSKPLRKSHFGSEVTPTRSEKVTSVPKSLQTTPKKSLRFRSHFWATRGGVVEAWGDVAGRGVGGCGAPKGRRGFAGGAVARRRGARRRGAEGKRSGDAAPVYREVSR